MGTGNLVSSLILEPLINLPIPPIKSLLIGTRGEFDPPKQVTQSNTGQNPSQLTQVTSYLLAISQRQTQCCKEHGMIFTRFPMGLNSRPLWYQAKAKSLIHSNKDMA